MSTSVPSSPTRRERLAHAALPAGEHPGIGAHPRLVEVGDEGAPRPHAGREDRFLAERAMAIDPVAVELLLRVVIVQYTSSTDFGIERATLAGIFVFGS